MTVDALPTDQPAYSAPTDLPLGVVVAAMIVGTAGLTITGVLPVVLGGLAEAHVVTEAQAGPLATIEVLALALASGVAPPLLANGAMRRKAFVLSLLLFAANLASCVPMTVVTLFLLRGVAGVFEGMLLGVTILVTIRSRNPDRLNSIFWGVANLPMALIAYVLPLWVVPNYGASGAFVTLAGVALVSAGTAWFLPDRIAPLARQMHGGGAFNALAIVALSGVFVQSAAAGGAWAYMELLADQHRYPALIVAIAISAGLLIQVAGALIAGILGTRVPAFAGLVVGGLCQVVVTAWLALADTPASFLVPSLLFSLLLLAAIPFQVRLLLRVDGSRRAAQLGNSVGLVGISVGPSIIAIGVRGSDVSGAFWISAGMLLLATATYGWLRLRTR